MAKYFQSSLVILVLLTLSMAQRPIWNPGTPDITISLMKTDVNIVSNLAKTTVEIHFSNPSSRQGEG